MWGSWDTVGARVPAEWTGQSAADKKRKEGVADVAVPDWHDAEMVALEASLVAELNRLRQDPVGYIERLKDFRALYKGQLVVAPGNLSIRTAEGKSAVDDAIAAIRPLQPRQSLARSPALDRAALVHAIDLHQMSQLSHIGRDSSLVPERISRYGDLKGAFAEMISAGYREADLIVMQWLVDDGVVTRANRIHALASLFSAVGVGCAPHERYLVVCVATLAGSIEAYAIRKEPSE